PWSSDSLNFFAASSRWPAVKSFCPSSSVAAHFGSPSGATGGSVAPDADALGGTDALDCTSGVNTWGRRYCDHARYDAATPAVSTVIDTVYRRPFDRNFGGGPVGIIGATCSSCGVDVSGGASPMLAFGE